MAYDERMAVHAPRFYRDFRCIADKCRHSCCTDWEIRIDDATLAEYERTCPELLHTITECEDGPCFVLTEEGKCPHLDARGLCRIILAHGEGYLSEVCRNHPRYFLTFANGRREVGLGLVCEEACRLLFASTAPFTLERLAPQACPPFPAFREEKTHTFDPLPQRDAILARLAGEEAPLSLPSRLKEEYRLPSPHTMREWLALYLSLEMQDPAWKSLLRAAQEVPHDSGAGLPAPLGMRLLSYFVHRHVSPAMSEEDLRARLAFSILSLDIITHLYTVSAAKDRNTLIELTRLYSQEIEYSEENTAELIFELTCAL